MKTIVFAFAILAAGASAASAAPQDAGVRSIHVGFADLDLSRASGRTTLEQRVASAVRRVCPLAAASDIRGVAAQRACRKSAWSGAREQLVAAYGQSRYAGVPARAVAEN